MIIGLISCFPSFKTRNPMLSIVLSPKTVVLYFAPFSSFILFFLMSKGHILCQLLLHGWLLFHFKALVLKLKSFY